MTGVEEEDFDIILPRPCGAWPLAVSGGLTPALLVMPANPAVWNYEKSSSIAA